MTLTRQSRSDSEKAAAARAYNQGRIAKSLAFHRERLEWITAPSPMWGDDVSLTKYEIQLYGDLSREAIRLLEGGNFVAGGDA